MPRWLPRILNRVHELAEAAKIRFTAKALTELRTLPIVLDVDDVRDVLLALGTVDSAGRLRSATTGEWLYVWKPQVAKVVLYVKLIVRNDCVIVSFHEDRPPPVDEDS